MYERTYWRDHVMTPSDHYSVTDNTDGTKTITRAGTVMQQGTPQDQDHFNNIEEGIVDAEIAAQLILNALRQNRILLDDVVAYLTKVNTTYTGTVTLTNSQEFPFNNSVQTISIGATLDKANYEVQLEVTAASGNVGDLVVSNKLTNGFKLSYTGSASSVTVKWTVLPQVANAAF